MSSITDYSGLYEVLGYRFNDEEQLRTALTHSSYASEHKLGYEHNNERLEFIGDGYVDAVVGARLFEIMGKSNEGMLSRCRADVVCEDSLADVAASIRLGDYLFMGRGEDLSGGREKSSILADAFEALMGAVILDGGYDAGRDVILKLLEEKIQYASEGKLNKDFKTRLQEALQEKDHNVNIEYKLISESGPDHNKSFTIEVRANGNRLGCGSGRSKAKAEQAAAEDAILKGAILSCISKE